MRHPIYHKRRVWAREERARVILALLFLTVIAIVIAGMTQVARAHGTADWIQANPNYKTAADTHCCGPTDCERAPDGAAIETAPGQWFIPSTGQNFRQGEKGVYPAIRPGVWWCRRSGKVVCFFYEGGGT